MAQRLCSREDRRTRRLSGGFTIVEVVVAAFILVVGLVAVGGVVGSTLGNTQRSEYMTQAATLATEKLEDLNRYPSSDPNVAVTSGTSAGSLASDDLVDVTSNGVTEPVSYYDEVYFSPSDGALVETYTNFDANGNTQYNTTTYTPDGTMSAPAVSSTPPSTVGATVFKRRWQIDLNQPVNGVRTVTVLVTLENQEVQPPVTFQMSAVRP